MRKIIAGLCLVVCVIYASKPLIRNVGETKIEASPTNVMLKTKSKDLTSKSNQASHLDIESKFSGLSEVELKKSLQKNEELAKKHELFLRANQNGLDDESTEKMIEYIRVNAVIHQILLSRALDDAERDLL